MHIVFLTWKDIRHPAKGGAEVVMYNYAKRLVSRGHQVTWFASSFQGAQSDEYIDGIHVIRKYSMHTIWMFAWLWFRIFRKMNRVDCIIDEAGGWPLLSPLYEKQIPIYFFVHHIGDNEFARLGMIGKVAKMLYRWMFSVYKKTKTIAVSQSTKDELILNFGFESENITVIENACDIAPLEEVDFSKKEESILFLGRLMPIKRVEDAIRAFHIFRDTGPQFRDYVLDIVGNNQDAKYLSVLKGIVKELALDDVVRFVGHIEKEQYAEYVARHKIILVPSMKEGFGLIVLEANSYGIPAIGYDVAGLRDSIIDGKNGYLIENGNSQKMGEKLILLCGDIALYEKMSIQSLNHVKMQGSWDEKCNVLEKLLSQGHSYHHLSQ